MKTYFLDSSAVVRLYAREPGERVVRDLVRSAVAPVPTTEVFVCDLAYPEATAALHRIVRGHDAARRGLSAATLRLLLPRVDSDLSPGSPFFIVPEQLHAAGSGSGLSAGDPRCGRRADRGRVARAKLRPDGEPVSLRQRRRGAVPGGGERGT